MTICLNDATQNKINLVIRENVHSEHKIFLRMNISSSYSQQNLDHSDRLQDTWIIALYQDPL